MEDDTDSAEAFDERDGLSSEGITSPGFDVSVPEMTEAALHTRVPLDELVTELLSRCTEGVVATFPEGSKNYVMKWYAAKSLTDLGLSMNRVLASICDYTMKVSAKAEDATSEPPSLTEFPLAVQEDPVDLSMGLEFVSFDNLLSLLGEQSQYFVAYATPLTKVGDEQSLHWSSNATLIHSLGMAHYATYAIVRQIAADKEGKSPE